MSPRAAMVFAAGKGTRMGELTKDRPKPMVHVAGQPLIDHALALTDGLADPVVVNTHYLAGSLTTHLAGRTVTTLHEPDLLETGGGLRNALPILGTNPVFTLNSDAVWTGANPLLTLTNAWDPDQMDALLLLVPADRATGHAKGGDFAMDGAGRLSRGGDLVYTGAQITKTGGLAAIPEAAFSLNRLWDEMQPKGRLFGVLHTGGWCDVGTPEGITLAEQMLQGATHV